LRHILETHNHDQKKPPAKAGGRVHLFVGAGYCTFAVTEEFAFNVSVQVLALAPPLEHAPLQMASRPLLMLSVTVAPAANCADPVLPVATLRPAGFERMRSPLRPPAVTARDMVVGATTGFRVRVAERVTPPPETEMVASVCVLTAAALMKKPPVVLPAGISTEVAVNDAAGLLLLICSVWSVAEGAAMVTVANVLVIPVTEAGLNAIEAGWPCGVSISCD
jgi:hypothetical protein